MLYNYQQSMARTTVKRKLKELEDDIEPEQEQHPSSKRIKIKNDNDKQISSIFENKKDHNQFLQIYEILQKSKSMKNMSISSDINKEIAEYSTGKWVECGECKQMISVLFEKDTYFCSGCMTNVKYSKCDSHDRYVLTSKPDQHFCQHCGEKGGKVLIDCCDGKRCGGCKNVCCGDCLINRYYKSKYEIGITGACGICGQFTCEGCIAIPDGSLHIERDADIKCVCTSCCKQNKDLFKYV